MILKSVFIIAIVAVAMIGVMVPSVFAADAGMSLTATTEYDSNIISITGFSTNISDTDVEFRVVSPNGQNVVSVDQVTSDVNCEFSTEFNVSNWKQDGMYKITASHGQSNLYAITLYVEVIDGLTLETSTSDSTIVVPQGGASDIASDRLPCSKISTNSTESQTLTTDQGTLDVKISYDDIKPGELTRLPIEFINPMLQKTQVHVDYKIMITESGETIFQTPSLIHTSEGIINGFKFEFPQDGTYNMKIGIEGILFTPITAETVSFDIVVGEASAQPINPIPNQSVGTIESDKTVYEITKHKEIPVNIFGHIENSSRGDKVIIIITQPDGTSSGNTIFLTSSGDYELPYVLNNDSLIGQYQVMVSHNEKIKGQISFNVVIEPEPTVSLLLKISIVASHKTSVTIEITDMEGQEISNLVCNTTKEFICETYWSVPNNMIQGTYNIKAYDGIGNIGESNFYYESGVGAITTNIILQNTVEPEYIPESESPKSDLNTVPISKEIFDRKKTDTISSILFAPGFSYHFSLERDFTSELGLTESYYQLYKIIDDKTTKRIGDLRFYLGSSEWWDNNASLQENDTSGFNNIFKVKFFIMHKGDSVVAQQISNNLSSALRVLVPEWSNEIGSTSDTWLMDSLNYSERNDQNKRENSIMTQEKEIKILHDDLDWGTITLIVTENADTIKIPSVSTDGMKILNQLLDEPTPTPEPIVEVASTSNCGTGTELVNGICQIIQTEEKSSKGGGCLIATATYGSEMAIEVQQLRELRDNQLLQTKAGIQFMGTFNDIYYSFSPIIADYERENPLFKEAVKLAITPMISSLSLMENATSESEVLGLGISVIMLNLGMYLGVPAIVVIGIRKRI